MAFLVSESKSTPGTEIEEAVRTKHHDLRNGVQRKKKESLRERVDGIARDIQAFTNIYANSKHNWRAGAIMDRSPSQQKLRLSLTALLHMLGLSD